jgi:ribosomal protein S12 methylthiotransferase
VSEEVKKSRFQDIMLLQQRISRQFNQSLMGRVFDTLIDAESRDKKGFYIGRTYMDAPDVDGFVYVKKKTGISPGNVYQVKITDTSEYDVCGDVMGGKGKA